MARSGNPRPIAEIAADLNEVIKYLEDLGVLLMRGRIRAYATVLDTAERGEPVDRALLWSAACEISDLVAASSLHPTLIQPVRHRLATLNRGDPVFNARSGDDPGRSLCFELVTAAMLQAAGVRIEMTADTGEGLEAMMDRELMKLALSNIVENAIAFSPALEPGPRKRGR